MAYLWASYISFIFRATPDTLSIRLEPMSLEDSVWCQMLSLCGNSRPTVAHVLNGCPMALEQGRYTWHHDCVLSTINLCSKMSHPHWNNSCRPPQFKSYRTSIPQIWSSCTMVIVRELSLSWPAQQTQNQTYLQHTPESRTKRLMGFYSQTWPTKAGQPTTKLYRWAP